MNSSIKWLGVFLTMNVTISWGQQTQSSATSVKESTASAKVQQTTQIEVQVKKPMVVKAQDRTCRNEVLGTNGMRVAADCFTGCTNHYCEIVDPPAICSGNLSCHENIPHAQCGISFNYYLGYTTFSICTGTSCGTPTCGDRICGNP